MTLGVKHLSILTCKMLTFYTPLDKFSYDMTDSRHAYCIIAHTDYYCLTRLIDLIDDERNDIFLVYDKKSELRKMPLPKADKSRLFTPPHSQLIDIHWGGLSQLKAEILVLWIATQHGRYDYYHLISGQDLPLKSQDYIHKYMSIIAKGRNCISCESGNNVDRIHKFNCGYYHLFVEKTRCKNIVIRKGCSLLRNLYVLLQKTFGIHRCWTGYTLGKGANWGSFSHGFVKYLVDNRKEITELFRGVLGPDEIYKQTVILSSEYKDTIMSAPEMCNNALRHIDWNRGLPYTWRECDYDELIHCNELFARKFSSVIDRNIIDLIYNKLKNDA